jgi:hypothetical protein
LRTHGNGRNEVNGSRKKCARAETAAIAHLFHVPTIRGYQLARAANLG